LRAWWWRRQGLDGRLAGATAANVLEETGWARSVGGVGPYLTLFGRAGISREQADAAAQRLEIYELPAARGCTYVLPASDFALALQVGEGFAAAEMKVAYKLGVSDKEIDRLCAAVLKALAAGPLDPNAIREATGDAARNLGEEGKRKGIGTTLPLALGRLQRLGDIRRVPANGRFDQQRYTYALWQPNPRAKSAFSAEQLNIELARRYFKWIGPATIAEFQWFSALSVKAAEAAAAALATAKIGDNRLILAEQLEEFEAFKIPKHPQYVLLSSLDAILLLRRDLKSLLDSADLDRPVFSEKGMMPLGAVADLPSHGIFDRGRLIGLWEYDTSTESIAWTAFVPKTEELVRAIRQTEAFVRTQLGDARSFSLDSPKSRAPRIQTLRA